MSAETITVGYPVHAVSTFLKETTQYGIRLTHWTTVCGAAGTQVGPRPFGLAGTARVKELCRACFPGRNPRAHIPEPKDLTP